MKRVEAIIATEKVSAVNDALKKAGVGGLTVLDGKAGVQDRGSKFLLAGVRAIMCQSFIPEPVWLRLWMIQSWRE